MSATRLARKDQQKDWKEEICLLVTNSDFSVASNFCKILDNAELINFKVLKGVHLELGNKAPKNLGQYELSFMKWQIDLYTPHRCLETIQTFSHDFWKYNSSEKGHYIFISNN